MSDFTGAGGAAYMSNRMDWETPQELFDQLDAEFHFTMDAASSDANHKCPKYFTAENSAFNHAWGGGDGFLQSAIRQSDPGVGTQMQYGGQPQRHSRRHAATSPHRYSMVPTVHSQPCGGQVPQRPTPVRDERHTGRPGAIPQHDRRNAHRRKMKEGENAWLDVDTCSS